MADDERIRLREQNTSKETSIRYPNDCVGPGSKCHWENLVPVPVTHVVAGHLLGTAQRVAIESALGHGKQVPLQWW